MKGLSFSLVHVLVGLKATLFFFATFFFSGEAIALPASALILIFSILIPFVFLKKTLLNSPDGKERNKAILAA